MDRIDPAVFKSYDIRGVYGTQLDASFARLLGRALPLVVPAQRAVVGYDARLGSPELAAALTQGLHAAGLRVDALGLCPTEYVYYMAGQSDAYDLGVMVTASHNPSEYNGFKTVRAGAQSVSAASGLAEVRQAMERLPAEAGADASPEPEGRLDVGAAFLDFALDQVGVPDAGGMRLVVDAGNGVGGLLWEGLVERLGLAAVRVNFEPDGRFPNHAPDPTKRPNLEPLIEAVAREGADLGFAHDGDGDRVVVVLPGGEVVNGSLMTGAIIEQIAAREREPLVGVAQTCSRRVLDHLARRGIEPMLVPVGHAKIKAVMHDVPEMVFAGEDAGHYYYRSFSCCDSSLLTVLEVLQLAAQGRFVPLLDSMPGRWVRPAVEPSFRFDEQGQDHALDVCRGVAARALSRWPGPVEVTCEAHGRVLRDCGEDEIARCDGVRVDYADWWFCVRPSGTEPIARLALEAVDDDLLRLRTTALSTMFHELK